jgi:dienelactone hydrolase
LPRCRPAGGGRNGPAGRSSGSAEPASGNIELLTGDNQRVAHAVAGQLEIEYRASLLPEDKIAVVRELARSDIAQERSGLMGTCVGGAFALMAAADSRIRDRVAFVCAYVPYASMWTLSLDIASATGQRDGVRNRGLSTRSRGRCTSIP